MKNSIKLPEQKTVTVNNFNVVGKKLKNPDTDTSITVSVTSSHLLKN